jgi:rare lipoprotein A
LLAGCGAERHKQDARNIPPPLPPASADIPHNAPSIPSPSPLPPESTNSKTKGRTGKPRTVTDLPSPDARDKSADEEISVPSDAKVLYRETGYASWYGPGFQKRRGANGEVFDTEKMTAAHRTLPLNSIARITDVKTNVSVLVRITDRGPFVGDRVLDLSRAAARKLSVFQHGTALVRIEVLEAPADITSGGRWCVQIGAFQDKDDATRLKEKLTRRYHTAKVLQFSSPMGGDWLRIRVADDEKGRAESVMRETQTQSDVKKFLVRLD